MGVEWGDFLYFTTGLPESQTFVPDLFTKKTLTFRTILL